MGKKIFIVRHGKSDWGTPDMPDIDRPLKPRGVRDAYKMAKLLKKKKEQVDFIISSPATRAIHTAIIFSRVLQIPEKNILIEYGLYMADSVSIKEYCHKISDEYNGVMIVGHNPGFTNFANKFTPSEINNVPTSGLVILDFDCNSWKDINPGVLKNHFFDYPKKNRILK